MWGAGGGNSYNFVCAARKPSHHGMQLHKSEAGFQEPGNNMPERSIVDPLGALSFSTFLAVWMIVSYQPNARPCRPAALTKRAFIS